MFSEVSDQLSIPYRVKDVDLRQYVDISIPSESRYCMRKGLMPLEPGIRLGIIQRTSESTAD